MLFGTDKLKHSHLRIQFKWPNYW